MISPEALRKFPFFSFLAGDLFDKIAMLADEVTWEADEIVFEISKNADYLYLLGTGEIELHYMVKDELISEKSKEFFIGSINIGEAFGISSLIEPYEYTSVAVASQASKGVRIDAIKLRKLAGEDPHLGFELMKQVAKASFERLSSVRVELAAARS